MAAKAKVKINTKTNTKEPMTVLEVGGRAIYGFKRDPRKATWETTTVETRAAYRARMQELMNAMAAHGYKVVR